MEIKTVGDIKKLIKDMPDDTKAYIFQFDTVYDVDMEYRKQVCHEHNGKKWEAEGLMIEVDG